MEIQTIIRKDLYNTLKSYYDSSDDELTTKVKHMQQIIAASTSDPNAPIEAKFEQALQRRIIDDIMIGYTYDEVHIDITNACIEIAHAFIIASEEYDAIRSSLINNV